MSDVFVVTEHLNGQITETTFELVAMARSLVASTGGQVVASVVGAGSSGFAGQLGGADQILVVDDPAFGGFNPQLDGAVHAALASDRAPGIVLVPYTSTGMDIAPAMAAGLGWPLVSFCTAVRSDGGLGATAQLYAGKIEAEVEVDGDHAVFAVLAGAAAAADGKAGGAAQVSQVASPVDASAPRVRLVGIKEPEAGDVDITSEDLLVVVGRGIESQDNIEEAQQLADALGGAVAASRPIIDQGWLPKSRQVGKSGLTVKPKVYLTLGVSGAPEHIEGMKDAATIIAVNTDPKAPIFGVAHYGWVGDLFDILPELIERAEG